MLDADNLLDALDRELAVYGEILLLTKRHREALVRRDTDTILEVTRRYTPLLVQAGRLEQEGRGALERLASYLGQDPAAATVSSLAGEMDPESAARLFRVRDEITATATRLAEANWANACLLESALGAVQFSVQLLAGGLTSPESGYSTVEPSHRGASLLLDRHA